MQADSFGREENGREEIQEHARSPIRRLARGVAILALAIAPHLAAADSWTDANGFTWSYSVNNGDATITGVSSAEGDITIPASIGNNRVTCIGNRAFEDCSGLTGVTIGNGVTSIGWNAFEGCSGLTNVTIPDGVTIIEDEAFSGCSGLTGVTIPASVTSIGWNAFSACSDALFDTNTISGVKLVDGWAVGCSDSLSGSLDLTGIRGIGGGAFEGCSGLTSVTIPDGVTSIGKWAFSDCSGLTGVTIPDGVTRIGKGAFSGCSGLTGVTIPDGVTRIEAYAFEGCSGLTGVTIPADVTSIGYEAFEDCSSLTSVTIPAGVTSIGYDAFSGCSGLTSVTFDGDAPTVDMDGAFNGVSAACVVRLPRNNATYEVTGGTWQGMTVEWHDGPAQPTFSVGGKGTIAESGDGRYVVTANEGVALAESDFAFPVARKAYRVEIASGGATAVVALKAPFEVERSGAIADGPWTEDGEGSVTLNVEIVPGLYYAAASAASLDGLVCPGASAPATAATRLVVRKPVGSPSGFFKVWVSERPLAAGGK